MFALLGLPELQHIAQKLAKWVQAGDRLYLQGELGTGKTTFTRAFLNGLGYSGKVKSPTYTWVDLYPLTSRSVAHFDLYRLNSPEGWDDLGLVEYFSPPWMCLVEWHERAHLPTPMILLSLQHHTNPDLRIVNIISKNARGALWIKEAMINISADFSISH